MDTIRAVFQKLGHLFRFSKKERGGLPAFLSVDACLPCLDEAKVSTVNSELTNFFDVQRLHENTK